MKKYDVHISGFFHYAVKIDAENDEEAIEHAELLFEDAPIEEIDLFIENEEIL